MKPYLLLLVLGLLPNGPLIAGTYKWIDENGNVVYSQNPPPKGKYEAIRIKPAPRNSSTNNNSAQDSQFLKEADKRREDDKKLQAETRNSEKIRQENCQSAKKQFEFYTVYRRMKGKDGEYHVITDDEREKKLQQARQAIKDFCD